MNIKLSVLRKVWLLKKENKGYGGAPDSGAVKGKSHWGKLWAVLAPRLMASTNNWSLQVCQHKQQGRGGTWDLVPVPPVPLTLMDTRQWGDTYGTLWTAWIGTVLWLWDSTSCLPWLCRLLWQEVTWHGQRTSGIMIIFYFVFFHINISMNKWKTLSVSGTVTFLFFQVRHFFFHFHGYC